jgi:hypothetical protein
MSHKNGAQAREAALRNFNKRLNHLCKQSPNRPFTDSIYRKLKPGSWGELPELFRGWRTSSAELEKLAAWCDSPVPVMKAAIASFLNSNPLISHEVDMEPGWRALHCQLYGEGGRALCLDDFSDSTFEQLNTTAQNRVVSYLRAVALPTAADSQQRAAEKLRISVAQLIKLVTTVLDDNKFLASMVRGEQGIAWTALNRTVHNAAGIESHENFTEGTFKKLNAAQRNAVMEFFKSHLYPSPGFWEACAAHYDGLSGSDLEGAAKMFFSRNNWVMSRVDAERRRSHFNRHLYRIVNLPDSAEDFTWSTYKSLNPIGQIRVATDLEILQVGADAARIDEIAVAASLSIPELQATAREFFLHNPDIERVVRVARVQAAWNGFLNKLGGVDGDEDLTEAVFITLNDTARENICAFFVSIQRGDNAAVSSDTAQASGFLTASELVSRAKEFFASNGWLRKHIPEDNKEVSAGTSLVRPSFNGALNKAARIIVDPAGGTGGPPFTQAVFDELPDAQTRRSVLAFLTRVQYAIDTEYDQVHKKVQEVGLSLVELTASLAAFLQAHKKIADDLHQYPEYQSTRARAKQYLKERGKPATAEQPKPNDSGQGTAPGQATAPRPKLTVTAPAPEIKTWLRTHGLKVGQIAEKARDRDDRTKSGTLKKVAENIYHYRCPSPNHDYRVLGRLQNQTLILIAVYSHAKGGGKQKVAGVQVPAYERKST